MPISVDWKRYLPDCMQPDMAADVEGGRSRHTPREHACDRRNVIDNFETVVKRDSKKRGFVIAFSFGRGAREEVARARQEGLEVHLVTVSDLLDRLDEVQVQMGTTTPAGHLPGLQTLPMPEIDNKRRSADELIRSGRATGPQR